MGWTPLILATQDQDLDMMTLLLERGANALLRDSDGRTAYDWAVDAPEALALLHAFQ